MSWAKRNLYFLISAIIAVVLLIAAAWYCYSSSEANNAAGAQLTDAYGKLKQLKNPSDEAIQQAKDQTKDVQARIAEARKGFTPVPSIPPTNQLNERSLVFALRDTIDQLRGSAAQHNVILPPDFTFSFTLQRTKTAYDPQSWNQLATQLGEIKMICDTLFSCRVSSLDGIQREHTADDALGAAGEGGQDYLDTGSVTNGNIVITPYQVTFSCFTTELGSVLSSFANNSHTVVVKTLMILPQDLMNGGEGMQPTPLVMARGGLPVVIDEKKLKVTLFLSFVKMLPSQGG